MRDGAMGSPARVEWCSGVCVGLPGPVADTLVPFSVPGPPLTLFRLPLRWKLSRTLHRRRALRAGRWASKKHRLGCPSSHPGLRAVFVEMKALMGQWKAWDIHRFEVLPDGGEAFELCHLWRYRRLPASSQWVVEGREERLSASSGWVPLSAAAPPPPDIHLWPFNRMSERVRGARLRRAVVGALFAHAVARVRRTHMHALRGVTEKQQEQFRGLCQTIWGRPGRGLFRDDRVLLGLRCFVNELWDRVLTKERFSVLTAMRGFSTGVSTDDVRLMLEQEHLLEPWKATPNLWPLVNRLLPLQQHGVPLLSIITPQTLPQWLHVRGSKERWKGVGKLSEAPTGRPWVRLPVGASQAVVERFLQAPSSLVRAAVECRKLSYWGLPAPLWGKLEKGLMAQERGALVLWVSSFHESHRSAVIRKQWSTFLEGALAYHLEV